MEPSILLVSLTTGPVPPDTAIVHSLKIRYDLEKRRALLLALIT